MSLIFRQKAMEHIANPDQLDQSLQIVRPWALFGLLFVLLITLAGITWSILSTAPEKVSGSGVILSPGGVIAAISEDHGVVEQMLVEVGETVKADTAVALVNRPDLRDQLENARADAELARAELRQLQQTTNRQQQLAQQRHDSLIAAYEERLDNLKKQQQSLLALHSGKSNLREQGMISAERILESETQLANIENELSTVQTHIIERTLEFEAQRSQQDLEVAAKQGEVDRLERKVKNLDTEYQRKRHVRTPQDGTVVEQTVSSGDQIAAGQTLVRLLPASGSSSHPPAVEVVGFIPAADGRRVESGMQAQVDLSIVNRETDGYLFGTVEQVSSLPSSRESLMNRLRDDVLVDQILQMGAPVEVIISLQPDPDSPSGYRWSSGVGPEITVQPGTLAEAQVIVDRTPIISLLFPAFDHVIGWSRSFTHWLTDR